MKNSKLIYEVTNIAIRMTELKVKAEMAKNMLNEVQFAMFKDTCTDEEKDMLYKAKTILYNIANKCYSSDVREIAEEHITKLLAEELPSCAK